MIPSLTSPTRPSIAELIRGVAKVAGHRQVLVRLNALLEDDTRGVDDLVAVLRLDAGLCARVISAANTVFFRGGTPVASVDEAVIRVGVSEIRRLLLGSIAFELTSNGAPSYGLAAGELWNRGLATALAMDVLGREAQRSADVCYTIGLLHAIGVVVIDRWVQRSGAVPGRFLARLDAANCEERERSIVGATHAEVGGQLLAQWCFPEATVAAVTFQAAPIRAGRFRRLASLLVIARWLGETALATIDGRPQPDLPDATIQRLAGVAGDDAGRHLEEVCERFGEYRSAVGVL